MAMQSYHNSDHINLPGTPSRLILDISPELRWRLEVAAAQSELSIYEYAKHILEQNVPSETSSTEKRQRLNSQAVANLLKMGEEIMSAHPDEVFDSAETLHQLREERTKELEQPR